MDDTGSPATLATGEMRLTVHEAETPATADYGRERSPAPSDSEDAAYVARAFGPHHEVRLSAVDWTINEGKVQSVRRSLTR